MKDKKFPLVTILIVNWNGKHFLEQNLSYAEKQDYPNFEILIVDNGSTDGSVELIKQRSVINPRIRLIKIRQNLLFVRGNNKGIEQVLQEGRSKYIAFLNNDVKAEPDWISKLVKGFDSDKIGVCTSRILLYHPYLKIELTAESVVVLNSISVPPLTYYPIEFNNGFSEKGNFLTFPKRLDPGVNYYMAVPFADSEKKTVKLDFEGKLRSLRIDNSDYVLAKRIITKAKGGYLIQNAGTRFDKKRMVFEDRSIFEFDKKLADEIVDAGCAAAMLVRTDLLKKYGGFWDKYVMYWEDSELSFRLGRAGYKTKFVNDAVVYHQYWGSSGSKVTGLQTFYGTRNRLWFIRRYFGIFMFIYYYLRTAARTCVWGVNSLRGKVDARMFFLSYFRALVSALGRDNT